MIETSLEIPGIAAEALLYRPDGVDDFPGIIFLTDVWGIRPANIAMAKRLADKGFAVLLPNVFHRYGRIRPDGFAPPDESRKTETMHALFATLNAEQMASDGAAYAETLRAQKGVKPGKLGVVGYCYTGQMALRIAAAVPDRIAAAASFHGVSLANDRRDSPHRLLPRITARLYFGHAVEDDYMPAPQIELLEAALRDWRGAFQSETYQGAHHGWTVPTHPAYNELQAERAFEKEVELFDATLK